MTAIMATALLPISMTLPNYTPAYLKAIRYSRQVIVEKHIAGKDYRLLVVGDRLVAAAERRPACVVGNGVHTVAGLVAAENENPRQGSGP